MDDTVRLLRAERAISDFWRTESARMLIGCVDRWKGRTYFERWDGDIGVADGLTGDDKTPSIVWWHAWQRDKENV